MATLLIGTHLLEPPNNDTHICKKNYDLACLYTEKGSVDHAYVAWSEGQHRIGGMAQALTGTKIESTEGVIVGAGKLSAGDFIYHGFKPLKNLTENFNY